MTVKELKKLLEQYPETCVVEIFSMELTLDEEDIYLENNKGIIEID